MRRALVGGLSVLTASSVIGLAATQPQSVGTGLVDLAALIVVGSSTNPSGAGVEDFYGGKYIPPDGDIVFVNFFSGPAGIAQALHDNSGEDNVVLASGWGASNANQVLYKNPSDPDVANALWVLDNNLNIPNGGFATRYPLFSRLVFIDPTPTPTPIDGPITIVTRYEYDINSDAPAFVWNPVTMANSLVAYLYRHLNQADLELPVDADGNPTCSSPCTLADGTVVHITRVNNVTYVTYDTAQLPLLRPLRDFVPVLGNPLADVLEPVVTAVVNYGYPDNDPLGDPNELRPARLIPTAQETATFVDNLGSGVPQGLQQETSTLGGDPPTTLAARAPTAPTAPTADSPEPKAKPLTNVVKNSPMFTPGGDSGGTLPSGTKPANPVGAITDALGKALSNVFTPRPSNDTKDTTGATTSPAAGDPSSANTGS